MPYSQMGLIIELSKVSHFSVDCSMAFVVGLRPVLGLQEPFDLIRLVIEYNADFHDHYSKC